MSDKKQVIHVNELIIKADRVVIEQRRPKRNYDPFFGRPTDRVSDADESRDKQAPDRDRHEKKRRGEGGPFLSL